MKRFAPAAERNASFIIEAFACLAPSEGLVLEIASGSGQHAVAFAGAFPHLEIQPSDIDRASIDSIRAYRCEAGLDNLLEPIHLDASSSRWPVSNAAAIVSINMLHISPWSATQGLMRGAGQVLVPGGLLYLYGPFLIDGAATTESNASFDASLQARNPAWGIRDLGRVTEEAGRGGLHRVAVVEMPANNFSVAFRRAPAE